MAGKMKKLYFVKTLFRQVCQTVDIVLDFTNGLGYVNTATEDGFEEDENGSSFENSTEDHNKARNVNESELLEYYGYITIGLMWAPAVAYSLIFLVRLINRKAKQEKSFFSLNLFLLIVSVSPLAPLIPFASSLLLLSSQSWPTLNTVLLVSLMEGSLEASLQVIWQGYVINTGAAQTQALVLYDSQRINRIFLSHHTVAYLSIASSILVTSLASLSCFFPSWRDLLDRKKKLKIIGQVLLILTSQAFRTISIILIISYFDIFSLPIFVIIFISNLAILKQHFFDKKENNLNIQEKILLLFFNSIGSIPMVFYYGRTFVDKKEDTIESIELDKCIINTDKMNLDCRESDLEDSQELMKNDASPDHYDYDTSNDKEERENQEGIASDGVEKTIIKRTNILLTIPIIVLWFLLNTSQHFKYNTQFLITQDLKTFNNLALFVLVPLLVTSTTLSTNLNQSKMRKTKIALSFLCSVLSYMIAVSLLMYFNRTHLFSQCNYSSLFTHQQFLDFSDCQNIGDVFDELSDGDKWISFIGNVPNVLLSVLLLLLFLSFILIVLDVRSRKATCIILVIFAIFSMLLTSWSAFVVYSLGFPVSNESQDKWWSSPRCDFDLWNFAFYILPVVMLFNVLTLILVSMNIKCKC